MIENFDIINIEYMENGEETFDYPEEMLVSVETTKDESIDHTKDSIRAKIKSYIRRNFGNDVEVVDFLAFPVGSDIQLGQLSFEFDAETFEAREKKIGSITIVKNPNFPSGTHLQGYIKTNRAELRKVFGNPNMGESGDGKSKGKEWNLIVGNERVTIYDRREMDKKGTKYFNIGGSRKYAALLVAQALSIHRNERVHAKEITPKWLEDERRHEMVQSIDDYPDLTYERAKEYEDNRRRYRAESDGFGEYTLPFVGGQRERLEDKIANQLVMLQRVALNKGNDDFLHDIFKEGYGKPLRKMTDAELLRKSKEVEMDIDSIYGAETFEARGLMGDDVLYCPNCPKKMREISPVSDPYNPEPTYNKPIYYCLHCGGNEGRMTTAQVQYDMKDMKELNPNWKETFPIESYRAETFDVEFNEWAEQEMMSHGKDISFKDWAEDEGMKHGNVPITEWAEHEEESHDARYGAEDYQKKMYQDFLDNWDDEWEGSPPTFEEWKELVKDAEDWGGNPKGQLALALQKARENAKKPKKPLKIEKLDAEYAYRGHAGNYHLLTSDGKATKCGMSGMSIRFMEKTSEYSQVGSRSLCGSCAGKNAETSGQWEIGEQLEEAQMNAEWERSWLVKEYPHTITKEQHDEIIKLLDEHDPNENIYYVRYGDTIRIITPHGPLKASFLPTFSAESDQSPSLHYGDYDSDAQEKYQEFLEEWDGDDDPPSFEEWEKQLEEYDRLLQEYEGTKEYERAMQEMVESMEDDARAMQEFYNAPTKGIDTFTEFESLGYSYDDPPEDDEDPMPEWYEIYLEDEEWKDMGLTEPESFEDYSTRIKKEYDEMDDYFSRMEKDYERFGLHQGKKRKKLSGLLSEPFDEVSLDSGGWKSIAIGFGVATLTLFGLTKLRK